MFEGVGYHCSNAEQASSLIVTSHIITELFITLCVIVLVSMWALFVD